MSAPKTIPEGEQAIEWNSKQGMGSHAYRCGYCHRDVASTLGIGSNNSIPGGRTYEPQRPSMPVIYYCPRCDSPSYFDQHRQVPAPILGMSVSGLPADIDGLYEEARRATSISAFTSCVLTCRKLLMHIAVDRGAQAGLSFVEYIKYLADHGYIPPNGKSWVDRIRVSGNEANHEIVIKNAADADELLTFLEMLLRL